MLPLRDIGHRMARVGAYARNGGALIIDGEAIGDHGVLLSDAVIGPAEVKTAVEDVDGVAGGVDLTLEGPDGRAVPGRRQCEFSLVFDGTVTQRLQARAWLMGFNGRRSAVAYSPLGGMLLHGRISFEDEEDFLMHSEVKMMLDADPYLEGAHRELSIGSVTRFKVGGNAYTWPVFEITPAQGAKTVRVSIDGSYIELQAEQAFGSVDITIDCRMDSRCCRVNGSLVAPTLESDYPALLPGWRTVSLTGGTGTIAFEEMWDI